MPAKRTETALGSIFMNEEGKDSGKPKILEFEPLALGKVLKPIDPNDNILGEMLSSPLRQKKAGPPHSREPLCSNQGFVQRKNVD